MLWHDFCNGKDSGLFLKGEKAMLELLFILGFFVMLLVTGVSVLGILAAIVVATVLMFVGGLFALMIKLLPWLLLAVAVVWIIRAVKEPKVPQYRRNNRWRY
jgi:phage shock protein G